MTFAQEIADLTALAGEMLLDGRITMRDHRDIVCELEDNAYAIRGVREFLAAR